MGLDISRHRDLKRVQAGPNKGQIIKLLANTCGWSGLSWDYTVNLRLVVSASPKVNLGGANKT